MTKPSYEEVVRYCAAHHLSGRVDTLKFYDYYDSYDFRYKGRLIDWQRKAREWAARYSGPQTVPPPPSSVPSSPPSAATPARNPEKREFLMQGGKTDDAKVYLTWLAQQFGFTAEFS